MNTLGASAAVVTGARHARAGRNGQDAAAVWVATAPDPVGEVGVTVVCDGCSAGASSEVGARLGASVFARAVGTRLARGDSPADAATWQAARDELVAMISRLADQVAHERERALRDLFLFTVVAAAATAREAAVWALGDGAYSFGERTHVIGPFEDNQPPYLAYDLLGQPLAARLDTAPAGWRTVAIATDGVADLIEATGQGLERFTAPALVSHPDALRRELAVLARPRERIDWEARRVERTPAVLQDDCAVGVVHRRLA